ncbi:MAG: hypothetical protein WA210_18100, partial [Burkholderiaceae bacterium]
NATARVRAAQANPNVGSSRNPALTPNPRRQRTNSLVCFRNFGLTCETIFSRHLGNVHRAQKA